MGWWLKRLVLIALILPGLGFEWEGRLSRLRRELESADAGHRRSVVRLLSTYPARDVRTPLLDALADPDAGVRAEAAEAAGRVQLGEAVPVLLEWLQDTDADVRTSAARALGRIGDRRTVAPLVRALGDANRGVRSEAVRALSSIGTSEVVMPLMGRLDDADSGVRLDAVRALGGLGDRRAVVPLIGKARDDTPEVREGVYTALGEIGDERAVPSLLLGLEDPVEKARLAAIAASGNLGSVQTVEALARSLRGPDRRRSAAAVSALGAIGGLSAVDALIEALTISDGRTVALGVPPDMALVALVQLARRQEARNVSPDAPESVGQRILQALSNASSDANAHRLAQALGEVLTHRPVPGADGALIALLREDRFRPEPILLALAETGAEDALVPILGRLRSSAPLVQEASLDALSRLFDRLPPDGRAADPLLSALGRVPVSLREKIVALLGRVGAPRALPALQSLLEHGDPSLRRASVTAIGQIGSPEGTESLLPLLSDNNGQVRFQAARALSRTAGADSVRELVRRIEAREPFDRHAGILAIGGAVSRLVAEGEQDAVDEALESLARFAAGDDLLLSARAIDALGRVRSAAVAPLLVRNLPNGPASRTRATLLALGQFPTEEGVAAIHRTLRSREPTIRAAAAVALGNTGGAESAETLLSMAKNAAWPVNVSAAFGLARLARRGLLSGDSQLQTLCALTQSRSPYLRANVATALAAAGSGPCVDGPSPVEWLETRHAAAVRAAAAHWLAAAAERGLVDADEARGALEHCAAADPAPRVAESCRAPSLPALDDEADVYAYSADGSTVLRDRLVALRFADGSALVTHTDANGHLRLLDAPRGPLVLDNPLTTPLE